MLWLIFVLLLLLWLAGIVASYTLGGYIHLLLALAVLVLLAQVITRDEKRGPVKVHKAQHEDEEEKNKKEGVA